MGREAPAAQVRWVSRGAPLRVDERELALHRLRPRQARPVSAPRHGGGKGGLTLGGDPIEGPLDMLGLWFRLRDLEGDELADAVATLEAWLRAREGGRSER